jgi:nucleoside diphosphate kinase
MIGPENPENARHDAPSSVRALYGKDLAHNSIYGSPTVDDAIREIQVVFPRGARRSSTSRPSSTSRHAELSSSLNKLAHEQRTLALVKPDAYGAGRKEEILAKMQEAGFKVVFEKEIQLTEEKAKEFYNEHAEKPFYADLVSWMSRYNTTYNLSQCANICNSPGKEECYS